MVFSSFSFLIVFLPAVCLCYFLIPQRFHNARNLVLLAFSLFFYVWGEAKGVLLMLAVITVSYGSALLIERAGERRSLRRLGLGLELLACLGALGYFKYAGFFVRTLDRLFPLALPIPEIVMPIGISFFTFQSMSYVLDVYRGKTQAQRDPLHVALYVALFPQLVAGPIVRYETIQAEITERKERLADIYDGLQRFIMGLGKKVLLADVFGHEAEIIFAMDSGVRNAPTAWLGAVLFSLQIYYDFSGYSDMAIGLGRIFGFHFPENFNYPFVAKSATEFWRRWHITLSSWFRDYVYIPLGGNRRGLPRQILNLFVLWGLTGLWHGASWNYVLWGLYFCVWLILEKFFLGRRLEKLPAWLCHVYMLFFCLVSMVIFNSTELSRLGSYLSDLFHFRGDFGYARFVLQQNVPEIVLGLAICTPLPLRLFRSGPDKPWAELLRCCCLLAVLALSALALTGSSFHAFIYFRF